MMTIAWGTLKRKARSEQAVSRCGRFRVYRFRYPREDFGTWYAQVEDFVGPRRIRVWTTIAEGFRSVERAKSACEKWIRSRAER